MAGRASRSVRGGDVGGHPVVDQVFAPYYRFASREAATRGANLINFGPLG
jgi:hypothetical protein